MFAPTNIREYEQAVYIYWLGRDLPTVKIGHTNNPARRLREFANETGTPGHKADFAAIVWLDRRREAVELAVHRHLAAYRRDGEWFELTPEAALTAITSVAESMNIRYEVEDRADLTGAIAAGQRAEAERRAEQEREHRRQLDLESSKRETATKQKAADMQRRDADLAHAERLRAEAVLVQQQTQQATIAAGYDAAKAATVKAAHTAAVEAAANRGLVLKWASVAVAATIGLVAYHSINLETIRDNAAVQAELAELRGAKADSARRNVQLTSDLAAAKAENEKLRGVNKLATDNLKVFVDSAVSNAKAQCEATKKTEVRYVTKTVAATPAPTPNNDRVSEARARVDKTWATCVELYPQYARNGFCFGDADRAHTSAKNQLAAALNAK